jgi:hypothetical protein
MDATRIISHTLNFKRYRRLTQRLKFHSQLLAIGTIALHFHFAQRINSVVYYQNTECTMRQQVNLMPAENGGDPNGYGRCDKIDSTQRTSAIHGNNCASGEGKVLDRGDHRGRHFFRGGEPFERRARHLFFEPLLVH